MLVFNDLRILRSDFVAHGMGGWLRLVSWHLHGISARDVPGVTDVLQLAGWQQLTEVRLFCSRFRMRFFDSKDGIGDSRNRDEPENIRDSSFPGEIHHRDTESTKFSLGLPRGHTLRRFGRRAALRVAIHPFSSNFQTRKNADNRSNKPSSPLQILVLSVSPW